MNGLAVDTMRLRLAAGAVAYVYAYIGFTLAQRQLAAVCRRIENDALTVDADGNVSSDTVPFADDNAARTLNTSHESPVTALTNRPGLLEKARQDHADATADAGAAAASLQALPHDAAAQLPAAEPDDLPTPSVHVPPGASATTAIGAILLAAGLTAIEAGAVGEPGRPAPTGKEERTPGQPEVPTPHEDNLVDQTRPAAHQERTENENKALTGTDVRYARGESGARLFFRNTDEGIEIVGKSSKGSESRVIDRLKELLADEPYHVVERETHTTRFLLGADDDVDTVDDVDVSADLPDGSRWMASIITVESIARVLRRWSLTGEGLGGTFRCPDLVIPREPGLPAAQRMIDNLVAGSDGHLQDVFEKYEPAEEEGTYEPVPTSTPPVAPRARPHVVTGDGYTVTFMLDTTDDPGTVTDVGAVLELTDGTRWAARYMTLDAIRDALRSPTSSTNRSPATKNPCRAATDDYHDRSLCEASWRRMVLRSPKTRRPYIDADA